MTIVPRTGPLSASSALATTSWYQRGKSSAWAVSTFAIGDGAYRSSRRPPEAVGRQAAGRVTRRPTRASRSPASAGPPVGRPLGRAGRGGGGVGRKRRSPVAGSGERGRGQAHAGQRQP